MAKTSMMHVSREEFERAIEYKMMEGWTLKTKTERLAILEKEPGWWPYSTLVTIGLFLFVILFWFTIVAVLLFILAIVIGMLNNQNKNKEILNIVVNE
jgi:hypothetical protein